MYRDVIIAKDKEYTIKIPKEYLNQKIEIVVSFLKKFQKNKSIDFSKYQIESFKDIDGVEFQRKIRDEW